MGSGPSVVLRSPASCLQLTFEVLGFFSILKNINNWRIHVNGLLGDLGPIFVLKFDNISKKKLLKS